LSRQWSCSGGRSTYYYFGALKIFFSQLFRQFGILNCNLSDSLKNLPTLFQKWFEYSHRNKSEQAVEKLAWPYGPMASLKKTHCIFICVAYTVHVTDVATRYTRNTTDELFKGSSCNKKFNKYN
jgi:hypothetical protein